MLEKEVISLGSAAIFILGAIFVKPLLMRGTKEPHPNQLVARVCLVVMGLLSLASWYFLRFSR